MNRTLPALNIFNYMWGNTTNNITFSFTNKGKLIMIYTRKTKKNAKYLLTLLNRTDIATDHEVYYEVCKNIYF